MRVRKDQSSINENNNLTNYQKMTKKIDLNVICQKIQPKVKKYKLIESLNYGNNKKNLI